MKAVLSMLALLTLATALVSIPPPSPESPWLPTPLDLLLWQIKHYDDCFGRDPFTFTINQRCPEFI